TDLLRMQATLHLSAITCIMLYALISLTCHAPHRDLHSFPTRRSSDLGGTLVLWFRYGFHHKKAQEQSTHLLPLVRAWLGPDIKVEYRLKEANAESPPSSKSVSPEDDPFVREVVRRFDGRVTRVKEITE